VTKKEVVILQLDAWRFRGIKPRNAAGWMIQAIENNYEVPGSYFKDKKKQQESQEFQAAQTARPVRFVGVRAFAVSSALNTRMERWENAPTTLNLNHGTMPPARIGHCQHQVKLRLTREMNHHAQVSTTMRRLAQKDKNPRVGGEFCP
jgi:hypothetical protein